jgi:hypothetical protein
MLASRSSGALVPALAVPIARAALLARPRGGIVARFVALPRPRALRSLLGSPLGSRGLLGAPRLLVRSPLDLLAHGGRLSLSEAGYARVARTVVDRMPSGVRRAPLPRALQQLRARATRNAVLAAAEGALVRPVLLASPALGVVVVTLVFAPPALGR